MKPEQVTIRPFREDDRQPLKDLTVASFTNASIDKNIEDMFGKLGDTDWKTRKSEHIDDDVAVNVGGVLVAEYEGEIVGYITVVLNRAAKLGRIPNTAVDEQYRGLGIGKKLINAADEYMRSEGMTHAKIETLAQNEIGGYLYPKMGYREVARQVHYVKEL
jgi:ribosomal protein S18 acetylase RimI-like enzyme